MVNLGFGWLDGVGIIWGLVCVLGWVGWVGLLLVCDGCVGWVGFVLIVVGFGDFRVGTLGGWVCFECRSWVLLSVLV